MLSTSYNSTILSPMLNISPIRLHSCKVTPVLLAEKENLQILCCVLSVCAFSLRIGINENNNLKGNFITLMESFPSTTY